VIIVQPGAMTPAVIVPPVAMTPTVAIDQVATASSASAVVEPQTPFSEVRLFDQPATPPHAKPVIVKAQPVAPTGMKSALNGQALSTSGAVRADETGKVLKNETTRQQAENEFRKAYLLAQQGQLSDAISGYHIALSLDPTHLMAREALVAALQESKRYAEAESVLKEALNIDVKQTHFAMLLARLQIERNEVQPALDTLQKTLPYAERMADYQAFMAALLQRLGRHKEAITYYQKALEVTPGSGLWLMGEGISMQADHQTEAALETFKRALETRSLSAELQAFVAQRIKELKPKDK
jgi:MSHA biogenesis protein MshN